jgi:hypothetical protein
MTMSAFSCPNCGRAQPPESNFCPGCGTAIAASATTPQPLTRIQGLSAEHMVQSHPVAPPTPPTSGTPSVQSPNSDGWWRRRKRRTKLALIGGAVITVLIASASLAAPAPSQVAEGAASPTSSTSDRTEEATSRPTATPPPSSAGCADDEIQLQVNGEYTCVTESPAPTAVPTPRPTATPRLTWNQMMAAAENVSYDELFRHSARHIGDLVYFRGEVIQVLGDAGWFEMRISVTPSDYGFWDDPIYVTYTGKERFLVDDVVEFIGISSDLMTYESVMGGEITIPSVYADRMRLGR